MLGYASKLSCNSLSCSSASLQKLVQKAWHTSQSWGCLCWVPPHRSGTAGVSLGQAIPSCCDTTEVSCQQRVVLKWLILTKSVRVAAPLSFFKLLPAEGDLPESLITGILLPYQACEGSTLPTLPLGDAIYSQTLCRSEEFSSWPNAEL